MKDLDFAVAFVSRFAYPLLSGGVLSVGMPLLQKGTDRLRRVAHGIDATPVAESLQKVRRQHLRELGIFAEPAVFALDPDSLLLLAALHDSLFLFHPRGRTLAPSRRAGLLQQIHKRLVLCAESLPAVSPQLAQNEDLLAILYGRYSLLCGLWALRPKSGEPLPTPTASIENDVLSVPTGTAEQPLFECLSQASPLTLLLRPPPAPLSMTKLIPWLRVARLSRLFVTTQLRHGHHSALSRIGKVATEALSPSGPSPASLTPADLLTLLSVFSLFHLRVAVAEDKALPTADSEPLRESMALFAILSTHFPCVTEPRDLGSSGPLFDTVLRYRRHCQQLSSADTQQRLFSLCAQHLRPLLAMDGKTLALDLR